jgi:hypothetical protein
VKVGERLHIPHSAFPDEEPPALGYWLGITVHTRKGGKLDIGIKVDDEDDVFTRPMTEVVSWVVKVVA